MNRKADRDIAQQYYQVTAFWWKTCSGLQLFLDGLQDFPSLSPFRPSANHRLGRSFQGA
jgi:hypothetical protein